MHKGLLHGPLSSHGPPAVTGPRQSQEPPTESGIYYLLPECNKINLSKLSLYKFYGTPSTDLLLCAEFEV